MKLILTTFVIVLNSVFPVTGGQSHPANSSTQTIVGAWMLLAYEDHPDGGPIEYPFGKKPVGLLIYDAKGSLRR